MQKAQGPAQLGGQVAVTAGLSSTTLLEQSYPLCTVTVNLHGGGLASIFSDNGVTPLANPFTADNTGYWFFYAANNRYDVVLSGAGIASPITISDILLNDPAGGFGIVNSVFGRTGTVVATTGDYTVAQVTGAAPLASPALTGVPTAPTAAPSTNTTQLATTAFVTTAVGSPLVSSVFGRTGAVVAATNDYSVAQVNGAAPLASPTFTGAPAAPTPSFGDNTTKLATTAFVQAAIPATGVTTFNGRSGVVVPATADYTVSQVTGAAPLASPALTGIPTAPTAAIGDSSTTIATTQFVQQAGLSPQIFASVVLTSAQLKALHGTPINLIAAPGVGFALYILNFILEYKFNTTPYTAHADLITFDYGSGSTAFKQTFAEAGFFDQGASQVKAFLGTTASGALSLVANQPFTVYGTGGTDLTGGDGTAIIYMFYELITLQ